MAQVLALEPLYAWMDWAAGPSHAMLSMLAPVRTPPAAAPAACHWLCDTVEGWGPMSPLRDFDLTPCFQAVALWLVPSLVFIGAAYLSWAHWRTQPVQERSDNSLHLLHEKDGVVLLIALLTLVDVAVLVGLHFHVTGAERALTSVSQIAAALSVLAASLMALCVQHTMHMRARHGSDAALVYWTWVVVMTMVRLRTTMHLTRPSSHEQLLLAVPLFMRWLLAVAALALECCDVEVGDVIELPDEDDEAAYAALRDEEAAAHAAPADDVAAPESPLETANLFSRLMFMWMQPLMSLGASKYLTEADMWALPVGEDAERLGTAFQTAWDDQTQALDGSQAALEHTGKRRFWVSLYRSFSRPFVLAAGFKVVQDCLAFVQPQILRQLLSFVEQWELTSVPALRGTPLRGYTLVVLLFITAMMQTMALHQYFQLVSVAGMRARAGVISAIFRKSMRMSARARGERSTGDLVNLMSVDANRLPDFLMYAHILWSALLQISLAFISLYHLLGWSAFVGVGVMVIGVPLNTMLATYLRNLSMQQMKVRDRRTGLMNEIIMNIKSIKLFSWEEAFTARLLDVRNGEELPLLRRIGLANAGFKFFWQAIPFFVSLSTFVVYSLTSDTPLTADIVFPALSLYQLLNFPMSMLAGIVSMLLQTQVSAGRLAAFFDAEELDPAARIALPDAPARGGEALRFDHASFAWAADAPTPTLTDIDLTVRGGELLAVLGRVGQGKSSLLAAALGDMARVQGSLTTHGSMAYFSQGGWAMGASVRDNILFGRAYDEQHYQRCVAACALEPDLKVLEHGDLTEIGERGVSLSGGQRARVALARACYAAADIYLLDDPLAAVDAHVGAHIWENVIGPRGLLRDRTRIITTNAVNYLRECDKIVTLRDGRLLDERGTYDEVMAKKGDVYRIITMLESEDDPKDAAEEPVAAADAPQDAAADQPKDASSAAPNDDAAENAPKDAAAASDAKPAAAPAAPAPSAASKVVPKHRRAKSNPPRTKSARKRAAKKAKAAHAAAVPSSDEAAPSTDDATAVPSEAETPQPKAPQPKAPQPEAEQPKAPPPVREPQALLPAHAPRPLGQAELKTSTIRQLRESSQPKELQSTGSVKWEVYRQYIQSASSVGVVLFFVSHLVTQAFMVLRDVVLKQWSSMNAGQGSADPSVTWHYLGLYGVMGILAAVGVCVAPLILYVWLVLSSARRFHDGLFAAVLRYPLQWFETTPTGRLLNLFSRDVTVIDEVLPRVIQGMARSATVVLGVVCVVVLSVPWFIVAIVPLALAYRAVLRYYLASSRELKRIDAVSKSPVFTWFQESLGGVACVRAFERVPAFVDAFEARVDRNQMCYFPAVTCNRWLAVRIECLGSTVILIASTLAVAMVTGGGRMSAGLLGLMLSQVLSTTQTLNWAVRSTSEVEQNIVSVERVLSYSSLPTERAYRRDDTAPPAAWPERGVVEFRDYSTRYRAGLDLVLQHVSFATRPGERIGVVGRTGAGKSSLTLALFRVIEAAQGSIWIDGVDIATLGLHELRQAMAIIPQDPQLWQGTLRQNLDPLHQYSDDELCAALENARLTSLIDTHADGLHRPVSEGGTNFSAGQRQLICIARAMVRQSRILVLDEATSSIDLETDALIQQIVRSQFKNTTMLVIAHRLNTIIDSDRVLVLDHGRVAEFDAPAALMDRPDSLFASMARGAGIAPRKN